jgi:molecular chaperone DnaK
MHVGVDLGTTYSLISRVDQGGRPTLLPDSTNRDLVHTPSVVYVNGRSAFVGSVVDLLLEQDPNLPVVRFFKRQFGESTPVVYDRDGTPWLAEAIGALVLKKLRFDAETFTSLGIDGAAVTVPAHFNDLQRKAVKAAALLADLPLLGLVDEPVAAALHYGVTHSAHDRVLLVFDWGGGTFDATVLSLDARGVYVLAKTGLTELGGKELDEAIGARVLAQFEAAHGGAFVPSARSLLELRRVSEDLKIRLCMPNTSNVRQLVLLAGCAADITVSLREFLADIDPYVERAAACALDCVRQAGLTPADVHAVLLVGGSSLVPAVEQRIRALFSAPGQQVFYHDPTQAVAFGAALHAAQLAGDAERFDVPPEFRGVTAYSVGVRTIDPQSGRVRIDTLIRQNMPLPAKVTKTYYSSRASQQRIVVELVQFRAGDEAKAVSLGQLVVGPLPSPRQNYPVDVTVEAQEDGTIRVSAWDAETGVELQQTFGRDGGDGFGHLATQRALVRSTAINTL